MADRLFWMDAGEELRLVHKARRGEATAYATLIGWHQATLFRLTYAITLSRTAAISLLKETTEKGLQGIRHMPEDQRFFPWWLRITRNLAVARSRRMAGSVGEGVGRPTAVSAGRVEVDVASRLMRGLQQVDVDDRIALALRLVEGLNYVEI